MQPRDFDPSFLKWHLRDTRRLEAVGMPFSWKETDEVLPSRSYWECMQQLLDQLTTRAPTLRSLGLVFCKNGRLEFPERNLQAYPWDHVRCLPSFRFLPLVGLMTQLQSLALQDWVIREADVSWISHLSQLQNLKVTFAF